MIAVLQHKNAQPAASQQQQQQDRERKKEESLRLLEDKMRRQREQSKLKAQRAAHAGKAPPNWRRLICVSFASSQGAPRFRATSPRRSTVPRRLRVRSLAHACPAQPAASQPVFLDLLQRNYVSIG